VLRQRLTAALVFCPEFGAFCCCNTNRPLGGLLEFPHWIAVC